MIGGTRFWVGEDIRQHASYGFGMTSTGGRRGPVAAARSGSISHLRTATVGEGWEEIRKVWRGEDAERRAAVGWGEAGACADATTYDDDSDPCSSLRCIPPFLTTHTPTPPNLNRRRSSVSSGHVCLCLVSVIFVCFDRI